MSVHAELVDKRPDENPGFGYTKAEVTTTNQRDETVLTMYGLGPVEKGENP